MNLPDLNQPLQCLKRRWFFKMFNFHMIFMLPGFLLMIMSSYVNAQDYFISNPNTQNRFVPSSHYQNTRPNTRAGLAASGSQAGSYQEQILFIGKEDKQQQNQPLTLAAFVPFGQQYMNNRNDFYDASPRPFGVPGNAASGSSYSSSYTRSKSFKPNSSTSSFGPKRVNVPQQQTQFLQFNDQTLDKFATSNRLADSTGLGSSAARPFGNGVFSPNAHRNRPISSGFNSDLPSVPQGQQQVPFRNSRNRFHPSTVTSISTTKSSTASPTSKRFNRFGGGKTLNVGPSGLRSETQPVTQGNNPEFTRGTTKSTKRRPTFMSREVNQPIQAAKPQKNYAVKTGRIRLPLKDKLLKQSISASSIPLKPSPSLVPSEESERLSGEDQDDDVHIKNQFTRDEANELLMEKLQLQENPSKAIVTTLKPPSDVIKTIKDVMVQDPANALQNEDIQYNDATDEENAEKEEGDDKYYSDEYSQEGDGQSTEALEDDAHTTEKTAEYDEEYYEEPTVMPVTVETPTKIADHSEITTEWNVATNEYNKIATVTTTETSKNEEHHSDEESSTEYDDEDYEDEESGDVIEKDEKEQEDFEEGSAYTLDNNDKVVSTTNTTLKQTPEILDREVISVVTTKSVVNGSTAFPSPVTTRSTTLSIEEETIYTENKISPVFEESQDEKYVVTTPRSISHSKDTLNNATEDYVVVASVQTSRSINGARYLPFPAIQQEESIKSLSELERNAKDKERNAKNNPAIEQVKESVEVEIYTTSLYESSTDNISSAQVYSSTESIIDKLDRVQSELSSGLLAGKYPILNQMDVSTPASSSTSGNRFAPNIRKFKPKTTSAPKVRFHHYDETAAPKVNAHHFDETEMDELASLLPDDFKKSSYKNRKTTTAATTITKKPMKEVELKKSIRNSTISRSFKNTPVFQDISLAGLLPKGYKLSSTTEKPILEDILNKIKFDENLDKLLPNNYNDKVGTAKPAVTLVDDISKFLPTDFKLTAPKTSMKPDVVTTDNGSRTLTAITVVEHEEIGKFLPPGYKLRTTRTPVIKQQPESIDIPQLLPMGDKPAKTKEIEPKIELKDVVSLLPSSFKLNSTQSASAKDPASSNTTFATTESLPKEIGNSSSSNYGVKVVFPKGIHKRLGSHRLTTPRSTDAEENIASSPSVVVRKGPPMRATTEFTGWPTPSTTPISIEKLLEQAKTATINFEDLLFPLSTTSTSTTTTTTTTTTPKPTKPGFCTADCDLAATIKIIDGVSWKPEFLDHNTVEWKNLARDVEAQLNEVYSTAPQLNKWYKKVRIDSFSQGSILVDYYVELANITNEINTLEIKTFFHDALKAQPMLPQTPETENETNNEDATSYHEIKEEQLIKETFLMGKYIIDPVATDFSVIPKSLTPNVEFAEEHLLIPQWAIVVIVIGVGSLLFVVIFGITVLLNRQNRAKKAPIPLTNDMLNELKINHMGGVDNYGVDDFYNIDDAWNDTKQPIKPKRFANSLNDSNGSNIYDSWRSTRHGDYHYDPQKNYSSEKGDSLQRSLKHHPHSQYSTQQSSLYHHQYPDAFADAHQMYTYNNQINSRSSRYPRDYDPDF